ARPHEELSFELEVENQGNVKDTLIPELFGYSIDEYEFNISYAVLDIGESALFTLNLTMPHLPAGDSINLSVGDEHTSNAWLTLTSLRYYSIECTCPRERAGKPGETISIPLTITNTGNLQENITITPWSPRSGLDVTGGYVLLDMGDPYELFLEVTLPSNALNQEVIPLHINLTTGEDFHLNITVNITITEVRNIDLTILNTIIIPETDFTIYHYRIEAENTGNGRNTFYFKAEGDYPHYIVLPEPITLNATEKQEITAEIIVPINRTGVVDNYLVPTDAEREFGGLNLRIRSYSPSLITDVQTYQEGEMYIFNISVMNNGTRFERLALVTGLPGEMWDGGTAKGIIELMPGENESFELEVTTPNSREYWGGELSITLNSVSGRSMKLSLHKPPIPVLGTNLPGEITFEDTLMFTGTQSYWNIVDYLWDFGDGTHDTGVTVEYRYRKAGEFTLTLTVVDDIGFTASKTLDIEVVNQNPIPIIIANPRNRTVEVGVPIKLDATHSIDRDGDIVRYLWDFGDFTGEGNWPVEEHSYSLEGDYEVELSVWDNFGVVVNTTITVHVIPKTEKPGDTSQQIEEKTKTDPLSYLPAVLTVVIVLAGAALVFHKKSFIR
ncbi:MAG: PKD domain-containing protein, partial [Thermoplasmata archaeon]|nr:PKD domain-containing protein [Thermoplasmata archaeon]